MHLDYNNKTVVVTGGTRGIGKQIVNDLFTLGANVITTGTNKDEILMLNKQVEKETNKIRYFYLDILKEDSVKKFLDEIVEIKNIDCLVNNAGINKLNSIHHSNLKDWDEMINVNLSFPYRLLRIISSNMVKRKYGRIVNISSIFGKISKEKRAIYSATKFGLHGLTVGSSNDLAKYNVLVNTVSPGFVMTDLTKKNLNEKEIENIAHQIPAKRFADTRDISSVVLFILSNQNTYVTGQNIIIDGGFTNV